MVIVKSAQRIVHKKWFFCVSPTKEKTDLSARVAKQCKGTVINNTVNLLCLQKNQIWNYYVEIWRDNLAS